MRALGRLAGVSGVRRSYVRSVFVVGSVASGLLLAAAVGLASAGLNWATGLKVPLPSGAGMNMDVEMDAVSCASAGNCAAVGRYRDALDHRLGLLLSETQGTLTAVKASLPADADTTDPVALLTSVSCASAGNCAAVGSYRDAPSGNTQGVLLTESSGTWAPGVEAAPPSPASDPGVTIDAVSCTSPGNCVAVGFYTDSSGHRQGLLLTQSTGVWTAAAANLPADSATNPGVILGSVSCASTGNCTAVGEYTDTSGHGQGLLLTETSGAWAAATAGLPNGAANNPSTVFRSVSCGSPGDCSAVGYYQDSSGHYQGLLLTETSGAWGTGVKAPLPAGTATDPAASIDSVSCAAAGDCTAVGEYADSSGNGQGVLLTETSGAWGTAVKASLPAGAATNPVVSMSSVSCPTVGDCSAIGAFVDGSGRQGLLLTETAGSWASGVKAELPAGSEADPAVTLSSVSCPSASDCTAVGRYSDGTAFRGVLLSAAKAGPTLSVSAPSSGVVGRAIAGSALTATLSAGASPIGAIQYRVFGPQPSAPTTCASGGKLLGNASVAGNGPYHPSTSFTPSGAGTYWWYASYGGDPGDNAAASACGASMVKTVVVKPAPVLSNFKQTHARWREGGALPSITAASKPPVGTTFTFTISQRATVRLVFTRGNKVKGVLSMAAPAGNDRIRFQGRLSRRRRLAPGRYTVTIIATNADHATSLPKRLSFTIVS